MVGISHNNGDLIAISAPVKADDSMKRVWMGGVEREGRYEAGLLGLAPRLPRISTYPFMSNAGKGSRIKSFFF